MFAGGETGNLPLRQLSVDFLNVLGDMVSQQSNLLRALQETSGCCFVPIILFLVSSHLLHPSLISCLDVEFHRLND